MTEQTKQTEKKEKIKEKAEKPMAREEKTRMLTEKIKKVSEKKKKALAELVGHINSYNTIMISFTTNVPSSQLQLIRKKLAQKETKIRIIKKNQIIRALKESKKEKIVQVADYLKESSAVIFSNLDPFDLASLLAEYRYDVKAKAGQTATADIKVEAGPTDIPPGPIISELANAGIKAGVEGGKIAIKQSKVIVRKGEKIPKGIADILGKLDIKPFTIGLEPAIVYDTKSDAIYADIKIDTQATIEKLKEGWLNALALAEHVAYPAREVINMLIAKASRHANALQSKIKSQQITQNII